MSGVDSTGRISPSSPSSNAVASSSRPFPTVYPGFLATTDEPEYTSHTSPTSSKSSDSPSRLPYLHESPTSLSNSLGGRDPQSPAPSGSSTARPIPSVGSNDRHSPFPRRQASPLHGVERHSAGLNEELGIQRESSTDEGESCSRAI
jgi:hypothetical protein